MKLFNAFRTSATIPALLSTRKCMEIPVEFYYTNTYWSKHYLCNLQKEIEYVDKALKQWRRKLVSSQTKNNIIDDQRKA